MPWIKYKYSCHFTQDGRCLCDVPNIEVELSHNGKSIKVLAMIDSGCQLTNIRADIAEFLQIDLKQYQSIEVRGVTGKENGYLGEIEMKLKDFGSKFSSPVVFLEGLPYAVLLGQNNFFDTFDIKFEKRNNTFELKRVD